MTPLDFNRLLRKFEFARATANNITRRVLEETGNDYPALRQSKEWQQAVQISDKYEAQVRQAYEDLYIRAEDKPIMQEDDIGVLHDLLKQHDWFYHMADNSREYNAGIASADKVKTYADQFGDGFKRIREWREKHDYNRPGMAL